MYSMYMYSIPCESGKKQVYTGQMRKPLKTRNTKHNTKQNWKISTQNTPRMRTTEYDGIRQKPSITPMV
jgi:hypothetical protein